MILEGKAGARWIRMSPRKVRLVANMIRGKDVPTAVTMLGFSTKRAAIPVEKTIRSATANLLQQDEAAKLEAEDLFVKVITVDEGPTMRRFKARAMGRAFRIRKRTSHINVIVATRKEVLPKAAKKTTPRVVKEVAENIEQQKDS